MRGGSWVNNPENARADNRNNNNPDNRNNNVGFRVLSSSHMFLTRPGLLTPRWAGRHRHDSPTTVCEPRPGNWGDGAAWSRPHRSVMRNPRDTALSDA
ncbi:MAG: SUMF1/EgtB/PvdO family nonheme iron enzyme [Pseudomonadota bacterium]